MIRWRSPTSRNPLALLLSFTSALAIGACYEMPDSPVFGYELDDVSCRDFIDNDYDGLVDCRDPDCLQFSYLCGEDVPEPPVDEPENTVELCQDHIDNDNDGREQDTNEMKTKAIDSID